MLETKPNLGNWCGFLSRGVLSACMSLHYVCSSCSLRSEEGIRWHGVEGTVEVIMWKCLEFKMSLLKEPIMFFATESSLIPVDHWALVEWLRRGGVRGYLQKHKGINEGYVTLWMWSLMKLKTWRSLHSLQEAKGILEVSFKPFPTVCLVLSGPGNLTGVCFMADLNIFSVVQLSVSVSNHYWLYMLQEGRH